ncbi:MAG: HD domain-containing phosphohydrolase [Proteocatella sp.]
MEKIDLECENQVVKGFQYETKEIGIVRNATNRMLKRIYEQNENLNNKQSEISNQYMEIEALYEETNAINDTLGETVDALKESWVQTIRVLSNVIEANDVYTRGHCDCVTRYSVSIAGRMNLDQVTIRDIEFAALLHDVGKVGIPYHILNKPGSLTDDEYGCIKKHPEIPLESKILTVADSFDAMTSARPYRPTPMTWQGALNELDKFSGIQFDPLIVSVFKECIKEGEFNDNC